MLALLLKPEMSMISQSRSAELVGASVGAVRAELKR
jgi:hypothetical protein